MDGAATRPSGKQTPQLKPDVWLVSVTGHCDCRGPAVQEAEHIARIEGDDMTVEWIYSGYCRARSESAMEFSVES